MVDFETAQESFRGLLAWAKEHDADRLRNEAATRMHLIDRLFFECLGWHREDCEPEDARDGKYADYVFSSRGRLLLVEAKREGTYFELPSGLNKRVIKIQTLVDGNKPMDDAMRQAMSYAFERGLAVCTVANGHQLVTALASRQDGVPPMEGYAQVFVSLTDMAEHFRVLWDALSKPAMEMLSITQILKGAGAAPVPEKLAERIADYPGYRRRNELQTDLQILGDLFVEGIARTPDQTREFLERCYSQSGALSQYALLSKDILRSRYSALQQGSLGVSAKPATTKRGLEADILAAALSQKPIVLLGDVGVGKTVFIQNLVYVEAKDIFDEAIVLDVNFGSEPALTDDLNAFVTRRFETVLLEKYGVDIHANAFVRGVYHFDLERFKEGIYGGLRTTDVAAYAAKEVELLEGKLSQPSAHLRASLEHISKGRQRQVVVFLDNVDQRDFAFQERVFLIAQGLAAEWPVAVFVALRPDTFYRSRTVGSLTAYQPRVFSIAPPRIDIVVRKRLEFGISKVKEASQLDLFGPGLGVSSDRLALYLKSLIYSFKRNADLNELVDNLSGGNVRKALDFVSTFIGSGHVNTRKILEIMEQSGRYSVSHHEFLRAITYGEHEHYEPSRSPVVNVFDVHGGSPAEHFLVPLLVAFVQRHGETGAGEGYAEVDDVFRELQAIGFTGLTVRGSVERGLSSRLIEGVVEEGGDIPSRVRPTSIGTYTSRRLTGYFAYIDAVIVDTPIFDREIRDAIRDVDLISDRLDRARLFQRYLDEAWMPFASVDLPWTWNSSSDQLSQDILRIGRRLPGG